MKKDIKRLTQENIQDTNFEKDIYQYFKEQFDEEMSKSIKKRDLDKIEFLSSAMCEIHGDKVKDEDLLDNIEKLNTRILKYENRSNKKSIKAVKRVFPAVCCAVSVFVANCITVSAWNMNIVSAVIEFSEDGFSIVFNENDDEVVELPTFSNDPYGIVTECAKYDIYTETPYYLPDGFELTLTEGDAGDFVNMVTFIYKNGNQKIVFGVSRYWDKVPPIGIPSDEYNISEITVNGHPAIVSKEDNQFTVVYQIDKTVISIFTQDVDYSECDKIVASIR